MSNGTYLIASPCNVRTSIALRSIALGFRAALKADRSTQLLQWIAKVKRCEFGPVVCFAYGLQKDMSAVAAAVDTAWSTG